jgi:hypothetical protein
MKNERPIQMVRRAASYEVDVTRTHVQWRPVTDAVRRGVSVTLMWLAAVAIVIAIFAIVDDLLTGLWGL